MAEPSVGRKAPAFELPATGDQTIKLSGLRGKKVVLYFYPKDNTSGCTREGQDFKDLHARFKHANAVVLGISRDSLKSHERFKAKNAFPFELLSDQDEEVCNLYQVLKDKNMYGRKVKGIERSTFLVDREGTLREEWRKVKVDGHAEEVLEAARALD